MNVTELIFSLVVKSEKALRALTKTKKEVDAVGNSAKQSGESIKKHLDTALNSLVKQALPIATVTGAMIALTKAQNDLVSVGKQAEATGIPIEDLQAWGRAADSLGYSSNEAKTALVALQEGMQEASLTGQGKMASMLQYVGISLHDANGKLRSSSDLMLELSKRFTGMSQQKAFYLGKMMGLTPDAIALLRKGRVLSDELSEAYKHVYSQADIDKADALKKSMGALVTAGEDLTKNLLVGIAPALTTVFQALMPIAQMAADNPFGSIAVAGVVAFKMLSKAIMANPIGIAISALTVALGDFFNFLNGAPSLTGNFLEWLGLSQKSIDNFRQSVLDTWEGVKNFFGFGSENKSNVTAMASPSSVYNGGNSSVDNRKSQTQIHNEIVVNAEGNAKETKEAVMQAMSEAMGAYGSTAENFATGDSY